MEVEEIILKILASKKSVRAADVIKKTKFSRAYINKFFQKLRDDGKIILIGKANQARYVAATKQSVVEIKKEYTSVNKLLRNKDIAEDAVLDEIKRDSGIFIKTPKNIVEILDYAFTEMLNNAIEHSQSKKIEVMMKKDDIGIRFDVIDWGMGIFRNLVRQKNLENELGAIHQLLKGKQTTAPKEHSGEGVFFTSKVADILTIRSGKKKLIFNNIIDDIFIRDIKPIPGTRITFIIGLKSKKQLQRIFGQFNYNLYEFGKTKIIVRLYKMDNSYVSRSQARRIVSGLDAFKVITLDFKNLKAVGQGFADEIFRVWQRRHPDILITYQNADENVKFMIERALTFKDNE